MKTLKIFALLLLSSLASLPASAAEKLCVGTHGEFRGYELRVLTSVKKLKVLSMPSNRGYIAFAGEYPANLRERRQPLGPLQLGYDGYDDGAFNEFFLDSRLLERGGEGSLDVTSHLEGSLEANFHCKDY